MRLIALLLLAVVLTGCSGVGAALQRGAQSRFWQPAPFVQTQVPEYRGFGSRRHHHDCRCYDCLH